MTAPDAVHGPPGDAAARARVLAGVAEAGASATLRPPTVLTEWPMRPLAASLAERLTARAAAGLDRAGTEQTRRRVRGSAPDPTRLSRAERRMVRDSRYWESRQPWIGGLSTGRERALVTVAADIVARICAMAAWDVSHLDGHRSRLDLAAELDQIDAQAFSISAAQRTVDEQVWLTVVDRVAALEVYATRLAALDVRLGLLDRELQSDAHAAELAVGASGAEHASDVIGTLADELDGLSAALAEVDQVRRRR